MGFINKRNTCSLLIPQIVNIQSYFTLKCVPLSAALLGSFLLTLNVFQLSSFPSDEVLKTIIRLKFEHRPSACVENQLSEKKVRIGCFSRIFLCAHCFKIGFLCALDSQVSKCLISFVSLFWMYVMYLLIIWCHLWVLLVYDSCWFAFLSVRHFYYLCVRLFHDQYCNYY